MRDTADVVVIGGGVIGASVAYHLASRGCTDVRVLERDAGPGGGSTGRATGGFRVQFGSEVNVRLSLLAREKLLRFQDETGVDSGYRPHGYLFLAEDAASMDGLAAARAVQHAAGATQPRPVTQSEAREINPALDTDGVIGGAWCPVDGFIRPLQMLRGYTEGAGRLGVRFDYGVAAGGFRTDGGRITAVRTDEGEIACGAVVNAAGAWAAEVARLAGVEIPVRPLRRQVACTEPTDVLPETMPLTVFLGDGFHTRVRDGRVLLLLPDQPADPESLSFRDEWLAGVAASAHRHLPCLRDVPVDRGASWCGLYEMSPDDHVLLGVAAGIENLYLANGSSGHGVMHSPALGHLLTEIILDGAAHTLDVHALRPSRFDEGDPVRAVEFW